MNADQIEEAVARDNAHNAPRNPSSDAWARHGSEYCRILERKRIDAAHGGCMMSDQIEEAVARAICAAWGYEWDGDPREDDQVAPDEDDGGERPSKKLFLKAACDAIATLEAARQK